MIWGRPDDFWQYWHRWYAWKPVKLMDGRWVWRRWVEYTGYVENPEVKPYVTFNCRIFSTSFAVRLPQ